MYPRLHVAAFIYRGVVYPRRERASDKRSMRSRPLGFSPAAGCHVIVARKPADIIADVLFDIAYAVGEGDAVRAEDVIEALESEGWFFVWTPDQEVQPTYGMRRLAA